MKSGIALSVETEVSGITSLTRIGRGHTQSRFFGAHSPFSIALKCVAATLHHISPREFRKTRLCKELLYRGQMLQYTKLICN